MLSISQHSKSLGYYDKSDLLKPEVVDPDNGYRYYSSEQLMAA